MGKYSSKLIGGGTEQYLAAEEEQRRKRTELEAALAPKEPAVGITEMITGAERETEATRRLPEFRETRAVEGVGKNLKLAAGLMFSMGDQAAQDVIKNVIPEAEFIKDEKGNVIVEVDGKYSVLNKPGFSKQDAVKAVTQFLAFVPAGKAANLVSKTLTKFGIGAAGTAATESIVQEIEQATGVEKEREIGRIITAGVTGGVAETVGPAWRGIKKAREAKKFQAAFEDIPGIAKSVKEAERAAEKTGIELAYPQKAAVPSQLEEMQFVAQLPAGTKKAVQFLKKQNKQAANAVEAYMTHLLPAEELTKATGRFRTAAQKSVDLKKQIRREAASPLYKKSFKDTTPLDTSDITAMIDDKITDFPETGEVSKKLKEIKGLVVGKKLAPKEKPTKVPKLTKDEYIESEGFIKSAKIGDKGTIEIENLTLPKAEIDAAKENIERGLYAQTEGPVKVVYDPKVGRYEVEDGYHRVVQALENGEDEIDFVVSDIYETYTKNPADISDITQNKESKISDIIDDWNKLNKPEKGQQTLKKLHNAKLEIDQMLAKFGEDSLGNTTKKEVLDIKRALVDFMEESSPDYKSARETFEKLSPDVTKMQESIVGEIAGVSDTQLKTISRRIFHPEETNVQTVLNAKKAIQDVDPGAWEGLLRVEFEKRLGKMASDIKDADELIIDNIPGQLHRALFKPVKQKNILLASLDGEMKENMIYLEKALRRAGLGRAPGSPTAGREEIKKRLQGGVTQGIRNFIGAPFQKAGGAAVSLVTGSAEEAAFNKRVRALAETLYNPEYKIRMSKIRKMNPTSAAALKSMTQLLNDINEMTE
jgi:hypothetical protein